MSYAVFTTDSANYTLSNGGKTVTKTAGNSNWDSAKVDLSIGATEKAYFEFLVDVAGTSDYNILGVIATTDVLTTYPGGTTDGYGYHANGGLKFHGGSNSAYGSTFTTGDVIGIAVDRVNNKIWWSKNGVWQASGDPAAGTNAAYTDVTVNMVPAVGCYYVNNKITIRSDPADMTYSAPTGFTAGVGTAPFVIDDVPAANKLQLTIAAQDSELTDFPVLVNLGTSSGITDFDSADVFDKLGTNSKKLAIEDVATGEQCYVEIENWDSANETAQLWTKVPNIKGGNDSYTKLLVHSDDTDGSTTFVDSSGSEHTITSNGDSHHETDQQKIGASSIYFDGTDDYITLEDSDDWDFGSGDFTIDFWVNRDGNSGRQVICGQASSAGSLASMSVWIEFDTAHTVYVYVMKDDGITQVNLQSSATFSGTTSWDHIALVRYGNVFTLYVNGISVDTDTSAITVNPSTSKFSIGRGGEYDGVYLNGYIDEFRISKGIARWTSGFTPTIAPYSYGDTVLNLYYDETQDDNTYVGDIGDTPAQSVWDSNFVAVYHMAQDPSGGTDCILDSTSNELHGTPAGSMTSGDLIDGAIGKAIDLDGSNDYINMGYDALHDITDTLTLECLFKPNTLLNDTTLGTNYKGLISRQSTSTPLEDTYAFQIHSSGRLILSSYGGNLQSTKASWAADTEFIVAGTYDYNSGTEIGDLFVDGVKESLYNDSLDSLAGSTTNPLFIGANTTSECLPAAVGEVRISDIVRSDDWIELTNLSLTDALITYSLLVSGSTDRKIPSFANFPRPYNYSFMPGLKPAGLIRQTRKGFSKAF